MGGHHGTVIVAIMEKSPGQDKTGAFFIFMKPKDYFRFLTPAERSVYTAWRYFSDFGHIG